MDLSLSSKDELIDELNRHFPAVVIIYLDRENRPLDSVRYSYNGGMYTAIGLCESMKEMLLEVAREDGRDFLKE